MKDFGGKLAVITGGGTGMGRELARQLVAEGCDVAMCDVIDANLQETRSLCAIDSPQGVRVTTHHCDVANEVDVIRFRDEVIERHGRDHINLLFNNAGIGGVFSFLDDDSRADWERTFNICWYGVYYSSRAFMPLLVKSEEGHLVNTSSINGFWATLSPLTTHSAYAAAKFAVKGFTEALINDLRLNAPHVKVSVVMPGHIGTSIAINSRTVLGNKAAADMTSEDILPIRERLAKQGIATDGVSDNEIREMIRLRGESFRDNAPMTAAEAARDILIGVKQERWRILLGADAALLDAMVREDPEAAYSEPFYTKFQKAANWTLG